jgi:HlyD family secretion protein
VNSIRLFIGSQSLFPNHSGRSNVLLILILLLVIGLGFYARQQWQGPVLPGYKIALQPLQQQVVASGTVSSQALARIGSEVTGVLKARHVREGDAVKPGDLLLELYDDEQQAHVHEAEAALDELQNSTRPQTEAALREAQNDYDRASRERERRETLKTRQQISVEQLDQARSAEITALAARDRVQIQLAALAPGGIQEQQLAQRLAAAQAALAKTRIVSSVAGTVQSRDVEPGDLVQPGKTLLEIYSEIGREIVMPVDEKSFGALAIGQSAQLSADAYPEILLDATVSFLAPAVDTSRGTVDVHLSLKEEADFLRQGMTVSVTITTAKREQAIVVTNDVLRNIRGNSAEVLRIRDSRVEKITVKLGLRGIVASEIVAGLAAGDVVLRADAEEGARVRVQQQVQVSTREA